MTCEAHLVINVSKLDNDIYNIFYLGAQSRIAMEVNEIIPCMLS